MKSIDAIMKDMPLASLPYNLFNYQKQVSIDIVFFFYSHSCHCSQNLITRLSNPKF